MERSVDAAAVPDIKVSEDLSLWVDAVHESIFGLAREAMRACLVPFSPMNASNDKVLRIGMAGLGVVGQGVWKHLDSHRGPLEARLGARLELYCAAVRDPSRTREVELQPGQLRRNPVEVATDPEVDLFCELMGGTDVALKATLAALEAGKMVVTANKALICEHGKEIFAAAARNDARLYFEASVAGGIPIIKALREGLVANRFPLIYGILNGTCNYILTRMEAERQGFETIVADARRLGYVEADEALDLDGWDAAHKAVILAYLAHGHWFSLDDMPVRGIREVTLDDMDWADRLGYRIKLVAMVRRDFKTDKVFCCVEPMLLRKDLVLAKVDGVFNGVSVLGDVVGESIYIGRGAGQDATASAVISDIVDAAIDRLHGVPAFMPTFVSGRVAFAPLDEVRRAYYLRLSVMDRPGVLAEVSTITARHGVSIESVLQTPGREDDRAHLVLTTHEASEKQIRDVVADLREDRAVLQPPLVLPIPDLNGR